ncbi:MAG: putative sulfatase [Candidatus Bathyarchaeota archaeon B26-2]|nr:MAG: putative sulfatase [Candidatus Bathyarchaeota archaeon B26-2]
MKNRDRPNILIFLMDTQPVRNMTPYGFPKDTTPNIQRIADEGVVYENHFVTGSWTVPSHASLFTGKYQSGHGAGVSYEFLSRDMPTMAEVLARAGYQTVAFSNNGWVNQDETDICRGFEHYTLVRRRGLKGQTVNVGPEDKLILEAGEDSGSAYTIRLVQDWFERSYNKEKPFFMFINCTEPHLRVWAPQPFRRRFLLEGVSEKEALEVNQDVHAERMGLVENRPDGHMTERDWEILKSLYDGETSCLDHRMGILFDYMESKDLLDETLLIITSDHGDLLDRRGYMGHHLALFDDLIHTPLIVRCPSLLPKGKRIKHLVQICDWLPTFIDLLGIEDPTVNREVQGVSLVPTWDDEPVRDFVVAEYQKPLQTIERALRRDPEFDYRPWLRRIKTIRTLEWKYIWYSDGKDMIFNIRSDPGERENLIEEERAKAKELRRQLERFLLTIERRDYGDKLRNHSFRKVRWENVHRMKAWGIYRELRFPT